MRIRFGFGLPGPFYVSSGRRRRQRATHADVLIAGFCFVMFFIGIVYELVHALVTGI